MTRVAKKYHHRNLRQALIEQALTRLQSGGDGDLSLRELAKACGVSPNAPYRHFDSKESLMAAIAAHGFGLLANELSAAREDGPVKQFREMGQQFSTFASANQALFRLMFASPAGSNTLGTEFSDARGRCFQVVTERVRIVMGEVVVDAKVKESALAAWCLLYGFGLLATNRGLPFPELADTTSGKEMARILARGLRD